MDGELGCLGDGPQRGHQQDEIVFGCEQGAERGALPGELLGHTSGGDPGFCLGQAECEGLWDIQGEAVPEQVVTDLVH